MTAHHTVVLIDGHALAFRSYFALPPLTARSGEATHAVLGFMRTVIRLMRQKGNQVIVFFDPPVKTFRHEQFDGYKAGRAETPSDLPAQINRVRELVDALGLPRLEVPGYEADDVIASVAHLAQKQGMPVRILTSDRDAYQLLTGDIETGVRVISSDFQLIGPDEVYQKYGVTVQQWVDYRSLTGDASDNIPGAKGIGPKTAAKLLQDHGTLEGIIAAAQDGTLQPKGAREKILASLEAIAFSHSLSCMVTDLPLDIELGALRGHGDPARLSELLDLLDLQSVKRDLAGLQIGEATEAEAAPGVADTPSLSPWRTPPAGVVWGYVLSREDDLTARLLSAATYEPSEGGYKPGEGGVGNGHGVVREAPAVAEAAAPSGSLELTAPPPTGPAEVDDSHFVGQRELHTAGAKGLAAWLRVRGLGGVTPGDDPMLLAYLLDPAVTTMNVVCERHLGLGWPGDAPTRAALTARLLEHLPPLLDDRRKALYDDIERPLSAVLAGMEARGIRIDGAYLRGLSTALGERMKELEGEIHTHAGHEFSISSRDQLEKVLYDELQLESGRKTKLTGKRSTAVSALEPLRDAHPIIPALLEYREYSKLKGTYLDPLPQLINPRSGRLHTTFSQSSVATGRLSSLNPNLQNIPIRSEIGREIRKGFIADEGMCLISADYSQIELRLLAHIAGDEPMQEAFVSGADIHRRTASQVLGVLEDLVTPDQRRAAKTVNFGVLYGMSAHRLSNDLKIPYADAARFIEGYFAVYPGIRQYIETTLAFGREHGYVETLYGRRRYVPELTASNRNVREAGERVAYNMPIQGTASDIIKLAMVRLDEPLADLGAAMLLQVHDELLVEAPSDRADEVAAVMREMMENVVELKVPLRVEVGVGPDWYDTK